ncbi:putative MFS transporter, partial [Aureobasidium melanogenum]
MESQHHGVPEERKSFDSINKDNVSITQTGFITSLDAKKERAVVWKLDLHLLPLLAIMYLFNSLDKSNMGNAKTAGLAKDLKLHGHQYNLILSIFYVPYVLTAPFLAALGKKYGPSRVLPCMMFGFGTCTLLVVAVHNFAGLMAIRWFLGMCESAFFPLVIYYQTMFYRRGELARRLAIFYAAQSIAGAFSGLIAFGVFHVHGGAIANWRYLFVIEGAATMIVSVIAFWFLPRSAAEARFLTPEEKEIAIHRIQVDSSSVVNEEFKLGRALTIFKQPTTWVFLLIEICLGVPLQGVQLFLPQIVQRVVKGTIKTNLYTVAPNITGAVMLLILGFCSDLTRWRFPFIALGFLFTFCGFIIFSAIDVKHSVNTAYFATFMMTWGTSAPSVLLDVWYCNNIADENKRAVLTSIAVPMANIMGVLASNIFLPQQAPKYMTALVTTATFGGTGLVLTLLLGVWMIYDNRRRDRAQGVNLRAADVPTEKLGDGPAADEFRWFY